MHEIAHKNALPVVVFTVFRSKFNCLISWTCVSWYCLVH